MLCGVGECLIFFGGGGVLQIRTTIQKPLGNRVCALFSVIIILDGHQAERSLDGGVFYDKAHLGRDGAGHEHGGLDAQRLCAALGLGQKHKVDFLIFLLALMPPDERRFLGNGRGRGVYVDFGFFLLAAEFA